jgi:PAS domain S-box-containing protein
MTSAQKLDQTEDFQTLQHKRADLEGILTLYDSLPCICFALNSAKIMLAVSQFAADCLGYEVIELAQQPISEVFYGQDQASSQLSLTNVQQQPDQIIQWETRLVRKNGSVMWVRAKASLMPNTESDPIITLICEDISESKQAQEIRRQSQMLCKATLEESRQQAEEALRQQFLWEKLLGAIAQRIHQSLNLDEILNTTVDEVRQVLACDRVIIFRLHPDGSGVIVVESVDSGWRPISGISINDQHFAQAYIKLYQQGRVQAVEDIYTADLTPCHRDLLAQFQVKANLVVPIVHEEQLWGLLVAQQCSKPRMWQSLEIDLLSSLATQAAIAIQQSELYQQAQTEIAQRQQAEATLQQQFQRERLVSAISGRIRQSLNLEEILNATAAEVRQVLQTDRVVIFRFEPDWSGNVVVESVASSCFSILGRNLYDPCFKQSYIIPYQQGRVKAIEDIYTANIDPCHINLLTQLQVRANLVVPILQSEQTRQNPTSPYPGEAPNQNQLWGLLIAHHCTEPRTWGQWEMDLLTSLASQVAIALQQSQLYEQAQYQRQREQALNQLTQAIRRSLDLPTIFSTATCEIEKLLEVDCVQIVQYLPEQELWVKVAESCKSLSTSACKSLEISDENNPIADRLKRLEVVRIDDTHLSPDEVNNACVPTLPGPWLLVPLHFGGSMWGALALVMNTESYHWQDSQVELICKVADQLAIALQQAELYKQSCTAMAQAQSQAQQVERTLIELRKTQAQLVQSEKMSSLGQLVAGVAHEINNPVSFIYGNLMHASDYTQDILGLLKLYQQYYPHPVPEIEGEIAAIDLTFLLEDLPKLLSSMKVGAERICEIVAALRNFSRFAEAEIKPVDLHDGVDSTLMILQNRLKASGGHPEIKVIKEYGNLPLVECYAGQLNQVFMNLLSNAIDAIDEQNQKLTPEQLNANPSYIRICTELCNDYEVAIRIADNGPGIAEEDKARLFDPFFTTKPVGTGTGLGLSISYQIVVEKHGGQLHCYSQLGQGTEFVIQIPIQQPPKKP